MIFIIFVQTIFMFSHELLNGGQLPEKTLCLTFDDGPGEPDANGAGPKTLLLAEYLWQHNICATFFVTGKHVRKYPHILPRLHAMGHIIGNHTYNHPSMPEYLQSGGNLAAELYDTEKLIRPFIKGETIYFRPPHGHWCEAVSDNLNKYLPSAHRYKAPIGWDIDAADWWHWDEGLSAEVCAENYLIKIEHAPKGIILMHDSIAYYDQTAADRMKANNMTYETVKLIVPRLKEAGYTFVGLNQFHNERFIFTSQPVSQLSR